jgi:hypothetical protein
MSKHSKAKSHKKQIHSKNMKFNLVDKSYDYDLDNINEPPADDLVDKCQWQENAQKLTSSMVMMIVGPAKYRNKLVSISAQIMRGLPKRIAVQAVRSAEDILSYGKSGHFVTRQGRGGEVIRFDTAVEASLFVTTRLGFAPSTQEEIELHLFAKSEQLEFLI